MDKSYQQELLLNLSEAATFVENVSDPSIKILLDMATYQVFRGFMRFSDQPLSDEEYLKRLPAVPFDMLFYVRVVKQLFENKYLVMEVLSGNTDAADHTW